MVDLSAPTGWGTYEHDGERYTVDDGTLAVDDEATARAIASSHTAITLPDDVDDSEGDDGGDAFDEDAWMDRDYQDRETAVRDGDVDEHLDAIADAETSETVKEAVDDRRDELEG